MAPRMRAGFPETLSHHPSEGVAIMFTHTVRLHWVLRATPERVYRAFLDADAMAKWLPPHGFTGKVHHLDAKVAAPTGCRSPTSAQATATPLEASSLNWCRTNAFGTRIPLTTQIYPGKCRRR